MRPRCSEDSNNTYHYTYITIQSTTDVFLIGSIPRFSKDSSEYIK